MAATHKNAIGLDAGFFIGLMNATDPYHKKCVKTAENHKKRVWITTWPVITEVLYMLSEPFLIERFLGFQEDGGFDIFNIEPKHITRLRTIMTKYADQKIQLADASIILLAEEHLGHGEIVATDLKDFEVYRWHRNRTFKNLLR